ncbi:MAG: hypothetical protein IKV88_08250 [Clostridia bacterium]|nr:hypothetical protein [Clostridia bacterium]
MNKMENNIMKVCSLLVTVSMLVCMCSVSVMAEITSPGEDYTITNIFSDVDFESGEINPADFLSYAWSTKGGYGISVVDDSDKESKVMKTHITSETIKYNDADVVINQGSWQINYPSYNMKNDVVKGHLIFEFDFKTENFNYNVRTMYVGSAAPGDIYLVGPQIESGTGTITKMGGGSTGKKVIVNKWHKFKFDFDVDANTVDFYFDDEILQDDFALNAAFEGFQYFNLPRCMGITAGKYGTMYVDNLKLYTVTTKYDVSVSKDDNGEISDDLNNFPLSGGSLKFEFSEKMADITKEMFSFISNGIEKDFDFEYDTEENTVVITPSSPFKGREECVVSFDGVFTANGGENKGENFFEFTVTPPDYGIKSVNLPVFVPGENATVQITVNNRTSDDRSEMVLVGIYKDNKLLTVGAASAINPAGEEKTFDVNLSVHPDYTEDCNVRVYIVKPGTLYGYDSIIY